MQEQSKGQKLQEAYRNQIEPYSIWLQVAVTLTLKTTAKIRVKRFTNVDDEYYEFIEHLDDEKLQSRIRYFSTLLKHQLFGNKSKHPNKRDWAEPLVITAVEGRNKHKRTHLHLAIGNIPAEKIENIESIIKSAWHRCDFSNEQICVKPITCGNGWLGYMTKEVGYTDNDALNIVGSTIPKFIQQRI
jgi:hypothetical protein